MSSRTLSPALSRWPLPQRKLASEAPPDKDDEDEQKAVRSAYLGVSSQNRSRKWKARIQHAGRTYHLGLFAEERLAARAFDSAARRLARARATRAFWGKAKLSHAR